MNLIKPLVHPACYADESPLGYLHRLAKLNHYKTFDWLIEDAPREVSSAEVCDLLSQHEWTGFSAIHPFNDLSELSYLYFMPANLFLCHLCLKENNCWDFRAHAVLSQVCIKHQCWKSDSCPNCRKRFSWRQGQLDHCECGSKRLKCTTFSSPQVTELASFLEGGSVKEPSKLVAAQFTYKSRCDLFMLFARNLNSNGRLPRLTTLANTQEYWIQIANILLGEKDVFREFLWRLHDRKPEDFTDFYRKLQSYDQPCLQSHRDTLVKFIARDLKTPITNRHRSLIRDKPDEDIWLSMQTASRQFMVQKSTLLQLIENGKIPHQSRPRKSRVLTMIFIKTPEDFQCFVDNYVNFEGAAKILGVTVAQLRIIIEYGYLNDICKPDGKHLQWLISSEELTRLRLTILSKMKVCDGDKISISDALAFYSKGFDALLIDILSAVFSDQITVVKPQDGRYLRDICLDKEEFLAWRKQKLTMSDTMSVVDLAKRFNINQEAMYQIVNAGLIRSADCGKNGMNRQISAEDINEFKEKYALLSKIAWALNKSPKKLKEEIQWCGVKPIDEVLGMELRQTIYSRSELLENCISLGYLLGKKGDWSFDKGKQNADVIYNEYVQPFENEWVNTYALKA